MVRLVGDRVEKGFLGGWKYVGRMECGVGRDGLDLCVWKRLGCMEWDGFVCIIWGWF